MAMDSAAEVLDNGGSGGDPGGHRVVRKRPRWVLPAVGASALMVAVAGAGVALGMMLSGGGTQPEELVPADAVFFADVDFDPSAGQKTNLLRLLNKVPDLRSELGGRDDLRQLVVDQLSVSSDVDLTEIVGWLGDRAGIAVVPTGDGTAFVVVGVLEVTDEAAARQSLEQVLDPTQLAFESGYVVVTTDGRNQLDAVGPPGEGLIAADVVQEALNSPLADDPRFRDVMEPLGDSIASVYVDLTAAADLAPALGDATGIPGVVSGPGSLPTIGNGQAGAVVRVEADAIEVVGRASEPLGGGESSPTQLFAQLPEDTVIAVDLAGVGDQVQAQWDALLGQLEQLSGRAQFERGVASFEKQYDVQVPEDVVTVLGDEIAVAVSGNALIGGTPGVGLRSLTDSAQASDLAARLTPLIDELTGGFGITVLPVDDGLVVASTPEYADTLAAGGGGILDNSVAVRALPDVDDAVAVAFVDFDVIGDLAGLAAPDASSDIEPLEALGVTVTNDGDGQTLRARLTFDE